MKKKAVIFTAYLAGCYFGLSAQSPVFEKQWDKRYGGTEEEIIGTFHITSDSGFVLCGTSFSGISGDKSQSNHDTSFATSDFWFVKTDATGSIQWDKRYGGSLTEILSESILTSDGGMLSGGQSYSDAGGDKSEPNWDTTLQSNDYWIIKTNSNGNKEWDKRFGGISYELLTGVRQTADGGYIISGSSFSGISGDKTELSRGGWDYWIVRIDSTGNIIWDKRFGGTEDEFSTGLVLTGDGNYLAGGYSVSGIGGDKSHASQGGWDYWIVKFDDSGNKIWDKTFGGNATDWLFALTATADGGFLLGGQSFSPASGDKSEPNHDPTPSGSDRWILKTDADGVKQWDRTIGGNETDDISRVIQTGDGGYLISGESYSDTSGNKSEANLGPEQTWVVKTDSVGMIQWDKTIFTYGHDELGTALPYGNDCFVVVNFTQADTGGYKSEIGWGYGDYWMIKMCEGNPLSDQLPQSMENDVMLYPNPVTNSLAVQTTSDSAIEFFDASGRRISAEINHTAAGNTIFIDTGLWSTGIYLCRVTSQHETKNLRLIKTE